MATETEAKGAATEHAGRLRKLGAHSIGTMPGGPYGMKGFVVVASVPPTFTGPLPKELRFTGVDVPVVVQKSEPFEPEKL